MASDTPTPESQQAALKQAVRTGIEAYIAKYGPLPSHGSVELIDFIAGMVELTAPVDVSHAALAQKLDGWNKLTLGELDEIMPKVCAALRAHPAGGVD